jgi:hypothetical protein
LGLTLTFRLNLKLGLSLNVGLNLGGDRLSLYTRPVLPGTKERVYLLTKVLKLLRTEGGGKILELPH